LTSGQSDAQSWASECPDVKNYKRPLPAWHRMLYSCTHMATVGVKMLHKFRFVRFINCSLCILCSLDTQTE